MEESEKGPGDQYSGGAEAEGWEAGCRERRHENFIEKSEQVGFCSCGDGKDSKQGGILIRPFWHPRGEEL